MRDLKGDLKGVWGKVCDLSGGVSCGSLTLKGISLKEGDHVRGDLMRKRITIEEGTRRRITRERGEGRGRKESTHEEEKEEGDHTREREGKREGGRARESLEGLKFLRESGGISVEKISLFFAGSHKIGRRGFGSEWPGAIIGSALVIVIIAFTGDHSFISPNSLSVISDFLIVYMNASSSSTLPIIAT